MDLEGYRFGQRVPDISASLRAGPEVEVQVGTAKLKARARTAAGDERTRLWESALEFWTYRANIAMTAAMARLAGKSSGGWRSASLTRMPRYGWLVRQHYSFGEIRAQDPPVRCVHADRKGVAPRVSEVFLPARCQSGVPIGSSSPLGPFCDVFAIRRLSI